ncbi:hypothetical protein OXX80_006770 [Metschnikowia pulcherrima]
MVAPSTITDLIDVTDNLGPVPCRFLYKKENQQPSGSFKLRGMSHKIFNSVKDASESDALNSVHVYCSSGGNAGLAAAYASKFYAKPCTVVLPKTAKRAAIDKLEDLGAEVIVYGAHWGEADNYLREVIMASAQPSVKTVYCHPFDDEILWEGHAAMADEIAHQLKDMSISIEDVKGIVCSCGGGGLYNGIVTGLKRNIGLEKVPVLVIETVQTPTFKNSVIAGKPSTLTSINTLSTSLASPYVAQRTFDNYHNHATTVELIDDLEAVDATVAFNDVFDEVIEPACGATVAVSMKRQDLLQAFGPLQPKDVVIFIVCGGSTVSPETMDSYRQLIKQA